MVVQLFLHFLAGEEEDGLNVEGYFVNGEVAVFHPFQPEEDEVVCLL